MSKPTKLPEGWKLVSLGEVGTLINGDRGKNYPSQKDFVDNGVPFINAGHIQNGEIDFESMNFISRKRFDLLGSGKVKSGDILYCLRGSLGKTAIIKDIQEGAIASSLVIIRPSEQIRTDYFYRYLASPIGQAEIYKYDNGSSQPNLSAQSLKQYRLPLPPLEEQRRIAAILDKADGVRRKRKEAIRLTEELLKSTFLEMFGDPVTNPKGWEICKIGKITDVKTGKTPSREDEENYGGDIRWVKTTEVRELIIKETEEFLTKKGASQVSIFPKNTILIAMYGQGATRGRTALLGLPCATNQACAAIMPSEKYAPFYLWTLLRLSYERLRELGRGGNQPNLNLSMVKNFLIPMPPLEKQIYFQNIVLNLQSQRQKMDLNLQYHDNLFNSLLQRAFRGEL